MVSFDAYLRGGPLDGAVRLAVDPTTDGELLWFQARLGESESAYYRLTDEVAEIGGRMLRVAVYVNR